MFDPKIAEDIKNAWLLAGKQRNQPEMLAAVPESVDLLNLLEVTFLASVESEEGRHIQTRIVFLPDAVPTTLQQHGRWIDALAFSDAIPLPNVKMVRPNSIQSRIRVRKGT